MKKNSFPFIPIFNIRKNGQKLQIKRILKNVDIEFWEDINDTDVGEAIEEYVRNSSDFYESIDWFNNTNDSNLYLIWLDWYIVIW